MRKALLLGTTLALLLAGGAAAQTGDVSIPAVPFLSSPYARFFPVAHDLALPPGGHVVRILDVFNYDRAAIQVTAHANVGDGALHVRIGFGPPHVLDAAARLDLTFADSDVARNSEITPIRGPRMAVVLDNERPVPATVSVGVYATN